jgi:8-oxo-dGTP pyrophosphatase MutT (NUDIX family)
MTYTMAEEEVNTPTPEKKHSQRCRSFNNSEKLQTSYGLIPYFVVSPEQIMFLIVQSRKGRWGFPKGHAETIDDSEQAVAYREFQEETGITQARIESVTEKRWTFVYDREYKKKPPKQIFFWIAKIEDQINPVPIDAEIQDAKWVTYDNLLDHLQRPGLKNGFLNVWNDFFSQLTPTPKVN